MNNYAYGGRSGQVFEKKVLTYLLEAKRVLKPNGRIILVQNLWRGEIYSKFGESVGLRATVIKLTPKQLENSLAFWIGKRSTLQKRKDMLSMEKSGDTEFWKEVKSYVREHKLEHESDIFWPCMVVLRK